MKNCPYCAEEIKDEAIKCKHCREWLKESTESSKESSISDDLPAPANIKEPVIEKSEEAYEESSISEDVPTSDILEEPVSEETQSPQHDLKEISTQKVINETAAKNKSTIKWKWKPKRWWICLIIYWFVNVVGAGIIARNGGAPKHETQYISILMVIFFIWSRDIIKSCV